jgi:ribosomal protein S18 acetylase RimI-like enzyme
VTAFRAITASDQPVLWELLYEALFVPPGQAPFPREIVHGQELSRYAEDWGGEGDLGLLAVDENGQPIGAAWVRLLAGDARGYGYIDEFTPELSIALFQEYRGRGIGTELLTRFLEAASQRFPAVSLSADPRNRAVRLYKRLGFEAVNWSKDSVLMKLDFRSSIKSATETNRAGT